MRRGLPAHAFDGRPHIAIANAASDLAPCNSHLNEVAESVKRGVWEAGGVPMNLPVVALGETLVKPTAMLWRNMAAMAAEEMLRANPVDGVVLLGGCDKTIPSLLMAAASVDLPAVVVPGGPMLTGTFRGQPLGCGTDVWKLSEQVRAGELPEPAFIASESSMIRSRGHCNTMGTASTMACMAEALGIAIPGSASTPAADSRLLEGAHATGRLAVEMVAGGRRPSTVLSRGSFLNAIVALAAIGGSTNAVVHLLAIAGRLGIGLTLDDFDAAGAGVPLLVDLQPAGRHLMEDFHRAGGLLAVLAEVPDLLDPGALTVTGLPLVEHLADASIWDEGVIRRRDAPLQESAGIAVLRGNLAPSGAVIKPAAASPSLLRHRGRAVVFDSIEDMQHRIDDPALDADEDSVLVLRGCGPKGYPGMPEVANLPLPPRLLRARRPRHGAHLRWPDERDGVWHGGPARRAGGSRRRAARAGATGDYVDPRCPRPGGLTWISPRPSWPGGGPPPPWWPASPRRGGAGSGCTSTTSCRPIAALTWTSCSAPAARRSLGTHTEPGSRPRGEGDDRAALASMASMACCQGNRCTWPSPVPARARGRRRGRTAR